MKNDKKIAEKLHKNVLKRLKELGDEYKKDLKKAVQGGCGVPGYLDTKYTFAAMHLLELLVEVTGVPKKARSKTRRALNSFNKKLGGIFADELIDDVVNSKPPAIH